MVNTNKDIRLDEDSRIGETSSSATESGKILETIFNRIEACKDRWPTEMFKAVLLKFKRMPRCGWSQAHQKFCMVFQANISLLDFKTKAMSAIVSATGKRCTVRKFERDPAKRLKTIDSIFEEKTLLEVKYYLQVKDKFLCTINDLNIKNIEDFSRTRKISSDKLNTSLLCTINNVIREYIITNRPKNMSNLSKILQAAQISYQEILFTEKKQSGWQASIESKIQKLSIHLDSLMKGQDIKTLNDIEYKALKKLMRENNLILEKPQDINTCISIITESKNIYQKKIDMYEKRKLFRKENQNFELNRRKFYRNLNEIDEIKDNKVSISSIKEYWSSMWNKDEHENDLYNELDIKDKIVERVQNMKILEKYELSYGKYLGEFLPVKDQNSILHCNIPSYP